MNHAPNRQSILYNLIKRIRKALDYIAAIGILISKEKRYSASLGFFTKLNAWRKGFLSSSYIEYFGNGTSNYSSEKYITDYQRWTTIPYINEKYGIIIADKLLITDILNPYKEYLPKVYYYINYRIIKKTQWTHEYSILNFLKEKKILIFKPRSGHGGRGVMVYQYLNNKHHFNSLVKNEEEVNGWITQLDNYIVMEYIKQSGYANKIFPHTLNTVRILTITDPITGQSSIAGAAHRFGTKNSIPADNWTNGGISTSIDLKTGVLGKSVVNPQGKPIKWINRHPDSKELIEGIEIPFWNEACNKIIEIANYLHYCPYIGWDIVFHSDSFQILEANDSPDLHVIQVHQPLLIKPLNISFFDHYLKK